jgi:hypothetical protein
MSQPGTNILLSREIRHHGVCEFQLDLPIERVDQIILGLKYVKRVPSATPAQLDILEVGAAVRPRSAKEAGRGL